MSKVTPELIKKLRESTGLGLADCKKALEESNGNITQAIEELRKKGSLKATKRINNQANQGLVVSYIHPGNQSGVLLEINCETDFVARNELFLNLAKDIALHIAAMKPKYLSESEIDADFLNKEKTILLEQLKNEKKSNEMAEKIVIGKLKKLAEEICLLNQIFIKNEKFTIADLLTNAIAQLGENIKIKRFSHFEIGG